MASDQQRLDAERKYLATGIEFSDLAKLHGVHERTIRRWAAAGDWEDRRAEVCQRASAVVQECPDDGALRDILHAAAERTRITSLFRAKHEAVLADTSKAFDLATLTKSWIDLCAFEVAILQGSPTDGTGALDAADEDAGPPRRLVVVDPGDPRAGVAPDPDDADG